MAGVDTWEGGVWEGLILEDSRCCVAISVIRTELFPGARTESNSEPFWKLLWEFLWSPIWKILLLKNWFHLHLCSQPDLNSVMLLFQRLFYFHSFSIRCMFSLFLFTSENNSKFPLFPWSLKHLQMVFCVGIFVSKSVINTNPQMQGRGLTDKVERWGPSISLVGWGTPAPAW